MMDKDKQVVDTAETCVNSVSHFSNVFLKLACVIIFCSCGQRSHFGSFSVKDTLFVVLWRYHLLKVQASILFLKLCQIQEVFNVLSVVSFRTSM